MCTGSSNNPASLVWTSAAAVGAPGTGPTVSNSNQPNKSTCTSIAMAETPQQCLSAPQPQPRTSSPSRARCRLLARGASCPQPGNQQQLSMESLEIVRPLACSHNCFVSIVRVPDTSSSDSQLAGTVPEPAAAVATETSSSPTSSADGSSSCKQGVAKSYRKAKLDEDEARQVELEIKLHHQLSACSHHVVPFWAALDSLDSTTILTAHCESDLRGTLEQAGGALSEAVVREQVAAPLLEVLVHMHKLGFVHRDIKPENVFVSGTHAMLGDFGLAIAMPSPSAADKNASSGKNSPRSSSRHAAVSRSGRCSAGGCLAATGCSTSSTTGRQGALLRSCSSTSSLGTLPGAGSGGASGSSSGQQSSGGVAVIRRSSSCGAVGFDCSVIPQLKQLQAGGTPAYTAPEVVQATFNNTPLEAAVGPQNDVWNLGVLIWEVLAGRHPFGDRNTSPGAFMCAVASTCQSRIAAGVDALPVSAACKDWLDLALQKDPSKRATAAQLLQHRWLVPSPASDSQQQQQQQQQRIECSQPSLLLQCCTSDDFPSPAATASVNGKAQNSLPFTADRCFNGCAQQQSPQTNSGWQTAAACSTQSSSSCAAAASRLVPTNGNVSTCSNSGTGGISAMSQQQFASYLQTIGSWED